MRFPRPVEPSVVDRLAAQVDLKIAARVRKQDEEVERWRRAVVERSSPE